MELEEIIEKYNELRAKCITLAKRDNGKLMGSDAWLRFVIDADATTLEYRENGIQCYGWAFSSQTMGNEFYSFLIPFSELQ